MSRAGKPPGGARAPAQRSPAAPTVGHSRPRQQVGTPIDPSSLTQCWLCFHPTRISSIRPNPSAAGIYFNGSTDDTESGQDDGPEDRRRKGSNAVEDSCSLPALQDMLEEFDVSKLEELAESLLANVTSELEGADAGSIPVDAQGSSPSGGMPGPVVGTPSERLESSEETDQGSSLNILNTHNYSKSPFHAEKPHSTGQQQSNLGLPASTILGTYDNESNCITIILNDDDEELPLEEEIICEEAGEDFFSHHDQGDFKVKLEPVRELLSPIPSTCSNYSSSDDLKPAASEEDVFKCPLTPSSFVSDGGYESLGSPNHVSTDFNLTASSWDGFWNLDLFPILTDMN